MDAEEWKPPLNPVEHWRDAMQSFARSALEFPTVIVLGSGVSCERDPKGQWKSGVWDVPTILKQVAKLGVKAENSDAEAYGKVMQELAARKGEEQAKQVIREAVLAACSLPTDDEDIVGALRTSPKMFKAHCRNLIARDGKARRQCWRIPPATTAAAQLVKEIVFKRKDAGRTLSPICVVTTNFDELFEVALRRLGVTEQFRSFDLVGNEFPRDGGELIHVWHVHGTWSGRMIHSPSALEAPRDKLEAALRARFDGAKVLVLGYGGWEDIVFGSLARMLSNQSFNDDPEVFWSFYEQADDAIHKKYTSIFKRLCPIQARLSTHFYKGVDLNREFPKLEFKFEQPQAPKPSSNTVAYPWSERVVDALEKLAAQVPPSHRDRAQKYYSDAKSGALVNFSDVVAFACEAYEAAGDSGRAPLAKPAREVIDAMGLDLHNWVKDATGKPALPIQPGTVTEVCIKSLLLIELLLAGQEGRQCPRLVSNFRGARNPRHQELHGSALFERGTQNEVWVHKFLELVWKSEFRRDEPFDASRDADVVKGRLKANAREKKRTVVLVDSGHKRQWEEVARQVEGAQFVMTAEGGTLRFEFDELELAHLISDFLDMSRDHAGARSAE